jgi:hypothetical protein
MHSGLSAIVFVAVAFVGVEVIARVTRMPVLVYLLALVGVLVFLAGQGTTASWFAFAASCWALWAMLSGAAFSR